MRNRFVIGTEPRQVTARIARRRLRRRRGTPASSIELLESRRLLSHSWFVAPSGNDA